MPPGGCYDPRDVKHIVLTHLDFDHAGGLDDFPWATVHMMRVERDYAEAQKTWLDRQRFRGAMAINARSLADLRYRARGALDGL